MRHGESTWNLENKFTGWYDCPLSPKGEEEVVEAGRQIKAAGIVPSVAFTSMQKRAIKTLQGCLEETDLMWLPTTKAWELNERHYGQFCFPSVLLPVDARMHLPPLSWGVPFSRI